MKKLFSLLLASVLAVSMFAVPAAAEGTEEKTEPKKNDKGQIEISTAEELAAVADDLTADYILTADIDLAGIEWTPIGTYGPSGESEEEQEIPDAALAFTGTFDGDGHKISNLTINQPEGWALGLFGCISEAKVGNFTLENASVTGTVMVSDIVGYAFMSEVNNADLTGGVITVRATEISAEGMYGGVVGAGMGSRIDGCDAEAVIVIPEGTANAGIVGGGLEMTSVVNSTAKGAIIAGHNCYGIGGISGCGFGAEEFTDCTAEDVVIVAGKDNFWIGGITGYAGGYSDESYGLPVTAFTNCNTKNVQIIAAEETEGLGDIVGAGFYNEDVAELMGAPFDNPTEYTLENCTAE